MNPDSITQYIIDTFGGVDIVVASGDSYFFYDPGGKLPVDHRFPFVTLVTGDRHDKASNLDRPGVYRLNIGVAKATYVSMFGQPPPFPKDGGIVETGHDFSALDQIMPHPVYAAMHWVCVLNPSETTFATLRPLLAEAYDMAAKRSGRQ